jgi:hypothetical protein
MDSGQEINIALDCEGWVLGCKKESLRVIQMAECFYPGIFNEKPKGKISINLQRGFLIRKPFSPDVIDLLSKVFSHKNVYIITFDYTSDITSMMEIGIKFNFDKLVDAQLNKKLEGEENFTVTKVDNIAYSCSNAQNCIEYMEGTKALQNKVAVSFDEIFVELKEIGDPFDEYIKVLGNFWEYAASEIALTSIALTQKLCKYGPTIVIRNSMRKNAAFKKLQEECGVLAPSLLRQLSFATKSMLTSEIKEKRIACRFIAKVEMIIENMDFYTKKIPKEQQCDQSTLDKAQERALEFLGKL